MNQNTSGWQRKMCATHASVSDLSAVSKSISSMISCLFLGIHPVLLVFLNGGSDPLVNPIYRRNCSPCDFLSKLYARFIMPPFLVQIGAA